MRLRFVKLAVASVAAVALVALGAGQVSARARAAISVCPSGCDYTTIQDAINAAPDRATIVIAPGTYGGFSVPGTNSSLTDVTLTGAGAAQTTITGSDHLSPWTVTVSAGVTATITGVKITDGGIGGIVDGGTLTVKASLVSGNGGPVASRGTLTLDDSTVSGNTGSLSSTGGGIANIGTVTLNHSTVSNNSGAFAGGGIENVAGTVTVNHSIISGNSVFPIGPGQIPTGGGMYNLAGTVTLKRSSVSDNTAGLGGGIYNTGAVTLKRSTVTGNTARVLDPSGREKQVKFQFQAASPCWVA